MLAFSAVLTLAGRALAKDFPQALAPHGMTYGRKGGDIG